MNRTSLAGAGRGLIVAALGLGLCTLRCGSSTSQPGVAGTGKAGSVASDAGANSAAGSHTTGLPAAGSPTAGSASTSGSGGDSGAADAPGGGGNAGGSLGGQAGAPPEDPPPAPETRVFVCSKQKLPTKKTDYAADLDGNGVADNQYGAFVASFSAQNVDLQAIDDKATAAGLGLQLLSLTVPDSNLSKSNGVSTELTQAVAQAMPDFSGMGSFKADPSAPTAKLLGAIAAGVFTSTPLTVGSAPPKLLVRLEFGVPVVVPVQIYALSYHVAANGLSEGQLNGAMLATDVDSYVPPALAKSLNDGCTAQPDGQSCKTALAVFDTNKDQSVSADEIRANNVIQGLLAPDVKLLDAQGHYAPAKTGVKDSYSIGIGFSAVAAKFAP